MKTLRILSLALLPILALTAETAPASSTATGTGCGVTAKDPGLRAAFAQFERQQSRGAAQICSLYLNTR